MEIRETDSKDSVVKRICHTCGSRSVKSSYGYMQVCEFRNGNTKLELFDEVAFYFGYYGASHFRLVELAVEQGSQRGGYGTLMIMRILAECRVRSIPRITLRCNKSEGARAFYEKMGFTAIGEKGDDWEMSIDTGCCQCGYGSPRWTGEIADCSLPLTFDTYSNCSFGCVYCFSQYQRAIGGGAESYLSKDVKSVDVEKVKRIFDGGEGQFREYVKANKAIQWGGLSDQFDGYERKYGKTLELLRYFKEKDQAISFSTKSTWWTKDERYLELFRGQKNWNVKFSIITEDADDAARVEVGVPSPQERLEAIETIANLDCGGATLRLRPFIIGLTSKTYKSLIRHAAEAGATAMTTEFFCLERRAIKTAADHYKVLSDVIGHDIVDFYAKNSHGSGYLRLNRAIKEPYVKRMRKIAHENGMRFYVSDAHFKEASDGTCCCALPEDWNFSRCHFAEALQRCKRNGRVTFSEIAELAPTYLDFDWGRAEGYNTGSVEKRAKFDGMSMKEYLRFLWNNPRQGQSPFRYFEGVMRPDGKDENGDVIYVYDQSRTFVKQGE